MEGADFPYMTSPYAQSTMEDPVLQLYPYSGQLNPVMTSYIDRNLQPSPSDPYSSQWEPEPPQVKRWISDDQRTPLFNADTYSTVMMPVVRPAMSTRLVRPPAHARFASPIASSDHGLTAPSPLAETESYHDNYQPSTPSDAAVVSPSCLPRLLEHYTSREEAIQFVNMGPAAPPAYVRPEDVDLSHQLGYHDAGASQQEFSFEEYRGYSFESGTSHNEPDSTQNEMDVALAHQRMSSPEEMRPLEMERGITSQYPPLPEHDGRDAFMIPDERPLSKRKKDDDHDYVPGKKAKSGICRPSRRTGAKPTPPKLSSPKKSPTVSIPAPKPPTSGAGARPFFCPHCKHKPFRDDTTLGSHVKKEHTRPFKCVFHFAGCPSTFAGKNEWKRHTSTQHLLSRYWLCTEGQCGKAVDGCPPSSSSSSSSSFNRKDLYTQHVRRMHMPADVKEALDALGAAAQEGGKKKKKKNKSPRPDDRPGPKAAAARSPLEATRQAWDEEMDRRYDAALRGGRQDVLPRYMRCPAAGCAAEFAGADAWDQRMEHVARHLDSGDRGEVAFGGPGDATLLEWAARADVRVIVPQGQGWVLNKAMRKAGKKERGEEAEAEEAGVMVDGEADAEGEEDHDL